MALTPHKARELRRTPLGPDDKNRVALAIRLSGEKQGDVAEALGWTQSYLSNIARSKFDDITVGNAGKLAIYFGVAIEDLFPTRETAVSA